MCNLDNLEKVFSIITGVISIGIAIWVIYVGQSQFKANLKVSEEQLKLYKLEREESVASGIPILATATSGFTPVFENKYYEYLIKLQNFGERPAYNIRIKLYSIGYDENIKLTLIDKFDEISANPMTKNMQWDLGRSFNTDLKSKIYICLNVEYKDIATKKINNENYLFFIPEQNSLINKKERGLINASLQEKEMITNFIKESL